LTYWNVGQKSSQQGADFIEAVTAQAIERGLGYDEGDVALQPDPEYPHYTYSDPSQL
jgi:hypothetical protein